MNREQRRKKNKEYQDFTEEFFKTHDASGALKEVKPLLVVPVDPEAPASTPLTSPTQISSERTVLILEEDRPVVEQTPQVQAVPVEQPVQTAQPVQPVPVAQPVQQVTPVQPVAENETTNAIVMDEKMAQIKEKFDSIKTEIFFDDEIVSIGASSVIGKREYQQDSLIIPKQEQTSKDGKAKCLCVLSDGMGGLSGGEKASAIATKTMFNHYYQKVWNSNEKVSYLDFFNTEAHIVNDKILELTDENGNPLHAGATMIAVAIDDNEMNFLNVGDSRIYIIRNGKMTQLTHDQNYLTVLMKKVKDGEITLEEAKSHPKREALVSYCGIKELKIKEITLKPVELLPNDVIMLCSDGLYRLLSDAEVVDIVGKTFNDMSLAAYKLTNAANNKNHRGQDNTSVILIKFN